MPKELRLKIAEKYLSILVSKREPKKALMALRKIYPRISRSAVYGYVAELRKKSLDK